MTLSSDLASGQKSKQVPYRALKLDNEAFVLNEYRPSGVVLQDPRNMHLEDIQKFLRHCYSRQAESGPGSAFRFALFVGPKRKPLLSNYPGTTNNPGIDLRQTTKNRHNKKDKGKQLEDAFEGLLRIDESEAASNTITEDPVAGPSNEHSRNMHESQPSSHVAGPSNDHSRNMPGSEASSLVRIGMGQMLELKEVGYEVFGPVNGPNEGQPEYEVPKAVLEALISSKQVVYPNQQQNAMRPDRHVWAPDSIDPELLGQDANNCPTTPPNNNADLDNNAEEIPNNAPQQRLGKRGQADLSPQMKRQTRTAKKKKKVTDDDLAALEAQKMVQSGSKRRSKPTQRK
jgi:hypothetical protein